MRSLVGCLMVVFSCGCLGISAARELTIRKNRTKAALEMIVRLRTEICVCRRSLPEAMERIQRELAAPETKWSLDEQPFRESWNTFFRQFLSPGQVYDTVSELGRGLSEGELPEQAFDRCIPVLESVLETERCACRQYGRVFIALGMFAGCLLTILTM